MCSGNCNQGRDCACGPGSGIIIVIGVAMIYGALIGAAATYIVGRLL